MPLLQNACVRHRCSHVSIVQNVTVKEIGSTGTQTVTSARRRASVKVCDVAMSFLSDDDDDEVHGRNVKQVLEFNRSARFIPMAHGEDWEPVGPMLNLRSGSIRGSGFVSSCLRFARSLKLIWEIR